MSWPIAAISGIEVGNTIRPVTGLEASSGGAFQDVLASAIHFPKRPMDGLALQPAAIAQMRKFLANLSLTQRLTILTVALAAAGVIYALIHYQKESDFKPLFSPALRMRTRRRSCKAARERHRVPAAGGRRIDAGSIGASGGIAPQHGGGRAAQYRTHRLRTVR
jgi:hypothetical protein